MGLQWIPALTGAEFFALGQVNRPVAWMSCHFSGWDAGLTGLPERLPEGSVLILDDSFPMGDHDPVLICRQLKNWGVGKKIEGIVLDLQRPNVTKSRTLAEKAAELPWPVAISELYARHSKGPVFLSSVPPHRTLQQHLAPWKEREIWLEIAVETEIATVTKDGCTFQSTPLTESCDGFFPENSRHMCYQVQTYEGQATITMVRNQTHIPGLLQEAEYLGVKKAIGLYQQFGIEI